MSREDGLLYFVQVENNGPIKVGYTGDLDCRLMTLQGWCPYKLEILFALRVPQIAETYCLEILRPHNIRGEWFDPHPFVKNFIDQIRAEGCVPGCPKVVDRPPTHCALPRFDKIIPSIWPSRKALMDALGQKTLVASYTGLSENAVCRIIIAARKLGRDIHASDLVEMKHNKDLPAPRRIKKHNNYRGGLKPSKPRNDFLVIDSAPSHQGAA